MALYVSDMPVFTVGEQAVLFLRELSEHTVSERRLAPRAEVPTPLYEVYGQFQGKLAVEESSAAGIPLVELKERLESPAPPENADSARALVAQPAYVLGQWRWAGEWPDVGYQVHTSFTTAQRTAIQNSGTTWNDAGARFTFTYEGTHSRAGGALKNGENEVVWDDLGTDGVLGRAYAWAQSWGGGPLYVVEADTAFNTRYTFSTTATPTHNDLESVSLHEFGHWLILEHSEFEAAVMWYRLMTGTAKRTLHSDDIAGIKALYGVPPSPPQDPVLSVTPGSRSVGASAGSTTFSVANTGEGTMPWTTSVTAGASWLAITSGASGTNAGTINVSYAANTSTSSRTGSIRVTATGATGSPTTVTVVQAGADPTLAPPTLISPAHGAQVAGTTVSFQWNAVAGASQYRIQISASPAFAAYGQATGTQTSASWSDAPNDGSTWYWRVRAEAGAVHSAWSATRNFVSGVLTGDTTARPGWTLFGLPVAPAQSGFAGVVIEPQPTDVHMFWWDPNVEGYRSRGELELRAMRGYWLFVTHDHAQYQVSVDGAQLSGPQVLGLGAVGWQMISVPYPVAWGPAGGGTVRVRHGKEEKSLQEAINAMWVHHTLLAWDTVGGEWTTVAAAAGATLQPWTGYFLFAHRSGLELIYSEGAGQALWKAELELSPAALAFDPGKPPLPPLMGAERPAAGLVAVAYPNPVRGEGVTFAVQGLLAAEVETIQVRVHDLSGRLVYEDESAGATLSWDTVGPTGAPVASGVYLYTAEAKLDGQWLSAGADRLLILR